MEALHNYVTNINFTKYDRHGRQCWNIFNKAGSGGREYYNDVNYLGTDGTGRILRPGHWIFDYNWHNDEGQCHNFYDDIKSSTRNNDYESMPTIEWKQIDEFDNKMDDFIEEVKQLTSALGVRLLDFMKVESMADVDGAWRHLRKVYFENFDYNDAYYVPVRRRISPDWLKWHKMNRLENSLLNTQQNDLTLQQYCLFLPYLATNFPTYKKFHKKQALHLPRYQYEAPQHTYKQQNLG